MEPLKVTLRFAAPVLRDSEHPIHLDAIIARALMLELEEHGSDNAWRESDDLSAIFEHTDAKDSTNGGWVWKASMLKLTPAMPRQWVNQIRKCDPAAYFDDLGVYWVGSGMQNELGINPDTFSIRKKSGQNRGYQWLSSTQWMDSAEAWAVADPDALQHYLSQINHIGKKGVNGYGRIRSFAIEKAPAGEEDNWMLRTLPQGVAGKANVQYEPVNACLRAPYWKKLERVMAMEPLV
jgi:CRISPR type IV-associated protein Csf3